ncbi:MAG: sensor histidine kinase [Lachnospiraceae bacterium]|jgi:two-component system sensor histidine kinase YesM|nr:sensor histidine kinase [Lachnospiraceae bacterium]
MKFLGKVKSRFSSLTTKIRISYLVLLLPNIIFILFAFYNLQSISARYDEMLNSVVLASEFSLDFKNDFDYETYLLIVGNVSPEETNLPVLLSDARRVVENLKDYTFNQANMRRLESAEKYLNNLEQYTEHIKANLQREDCYEDNILIWENDVQIVTGLIQESINEYIYYENKQLQIAQTENRAILVRTIQLSVIILVVVLGLIFIISLLAPIWITRPIKKQVTREQKRLRKAELDLLQAQINPHFLYNTLDAIVWSAEAGNQKQVVSMVGSLSDFFRTSLNRGKEIITIREELQHVRSYLEIQQIRYQDILSYEISVPEDIFEYRIPKITLQPLVENALYHGIKNRRGGGKIIVSGENKEDCILLKVIDDGMGMTKERKAEVERGLREATPEESSIYGLYNINERIRLTYGGSYGIYLESEFEKGTVVTVRLPKILTEIVEK